MHTTVILPFSALGYLRQLHLVHISDNCLELLVCSMGPSSNSYDPTEIVLEYYDVCLRQLDVDNFKPGSWLSDTNIEFYYEYLQRDSPFAQRLEDASILLLQPTVSFIITQTSDAEFISSALPPYIKTAKWIFCPINDNVDVTKAQGGSHWSLVVIDKERSLGCYYDSLMDCNESPSRAFIQQMENVLETSLTFLPMPTPQQSNEFDCGMFVCLETAYLVEILTGNSSSPPDLSNAQIDAEEERIAMLNLIDELLKVADGDMIGTKEDVEIQMTA
ncbi:NEDD8-specific protease 2 [Neolecta irregularis DAH-3]|uniref:NEDD8-specific protease 2 n=1 Tax=Neolecta irregularis (strain DAH-3) TaxID=1198029 RepID=A0A1U7LMG7_NEOID|nr:NEDD8-specific protease 2 [Neolecta irregularis DAH-3]|eukprot:OLL23711.1 NEDD8-specific protease 2 [Neolecta irregularis DAH-3]